MILTPKAWWDESQTNNSLENITNTTKEEIAYLSNKELTSNEVLDKNIEEIANEILALEEIQPKLQKVPLQGMDTKIPNIGNYDLWSAIRDEYKKIMKQYRRFREGRLNSFKLFKKTLEDMADKGIFSEEFKKYSRTIEDATSKNKRKFIARAKPLAKLLTIVRINSRKEIANIRYENNKEKNMYLKEWSPWNYEIIENDGYIDNTFVPKNTIEAHIEYYSPREHESWITKVLLEWIQLIKSYILSHPECPWVLMSSRLIYSIIKDKPNLAKRIWLNEKNTYINEKEKHATAFIDRNIFLKE